MIDDVLADPRYIGAMTDVRSQIAVPLRRKKRVIGALNLYGEHVGQFTPRDEAMLRQFGAHVAVAIENARLFEREKAYVETLETLAEIGREVAAILDLEQLLERVATLRAQGRRRIARSASSCSTSAAGCSNRSSRSATATTPASRT